jgi:hypothetical protein
MAVDGSETVGNKMSIQTALKWEFRAYVRMRAA